MIETTTPSIITDSKERYLKIGKLSTNPEIITISDVVAVLTDSVNPLII